MKWILKYIEPILHVLFWIFFFSSINVSWLFSWFDPSIRTNTPSPLSVLVFPFFFYANAFWLMPKYLNRKLWFKYILFAGIVFCLPEVIRILITGIVNGELNIMGELFARDSFLFGAPSPIFIALNCSFVYRFAVDWFRNRQKIEKLSQERDNSKESKPYENAAPISESEATTILSKLDRIMKVERLFVDSKLSLRSLAAAAETTDKKLSFVLNQSLSSNFYDYVNRFRVEDFKHRLADGDSENLSLVGLALECGFKSKSSFYRVFKSEVGCSPSEYLKKIS